MVILPILYVCCQCDEWSCCTYQQDPTSEKHEAAAQKTLDAYIAKYDTSKKSPLK